MSTQKKFLITGATGFLGRHVIEHLNQNNTNVNILPLVRNKSSWTNEEWTNDLKNIKDLIEGDLFNVIEKADSIQKHKIDGIFHFAAVVKHSRHNSEDVYKANIEGTLNMVRLAAINKCRLIYVSTSGTVGVFNDSHDWADENSPYLDNEVKRWPYYDSKVKAELKARKLADELGVELIIIRPPVLLGPKDHRFRSTSNIIKYLRGKLPFLIKGGMHFIDIRDASKALINAMYLENPKQIYHLSGVSCSIENFFKMVEKSSGVNGPKMYLPHSLALLLSNSAKKISLVTGGESIFPDPVVIEMAGKYWDIRSKYSSHDLGFFNRNGQDTINDTVEWLIENNKNLSFLKK